MIGFRDVTTSLWCRLQSNLVAASCRLGVMWGTVGWIVTGTLKKNVIGGTQSMHGRNKEHIRVRSIIFDNSAKRKLSKSNFIVENHS